jgi:hypothetical protein
LISQTAIITEIISVIKFCVIENMNGLISSKEIGVSETVDSSKRRENRPLEVEPADSELARWKHYYYTDTPGGFLAKFTLKGYYDTYLIWMLYLWLLTSICGKYFQKFYLLFRIVLK